MRYQLRQQNDPDVQRHATKQRNADRLRQVQKDKERRRASSDYGGSFDKRKLAHGGAANLQPAQIAAYLLGKLFQVLQKQTREPHSKVDVPIRTG